MQTQETPAAGESASQLDSPVLALTNIGKKFGGVTALSDVDFSLQRGEIHGLVGENGAGKSTLMKIIAGVHTSYSGNFQVDGAAVRFRSVADALDAGIGMVHQELSIAPNLTVAENVFLGVQPTNRLGVVRWREMAAQARTHLEQLGINVNPNSEAGLLPLGLQQLIELGRVLFSGARVIILDEPTSALSPPEVDQLFTILRRLRQNGTSFIFISHFLEDVLAVSDRVTVFRNAERVATAAVPEIDKHWLIEQMIGSGHSELGETYTSQIELRSEPNAPVVMESHNLRLHGQFDNISLQVSAGEVLGVYGFMGSGQLELAKALAGKLRTDAGHISIDGKRLSVSSTAAAWRAGIALVPESRRSMLFSEEPVYKNISISILDRIGKLFLHPAKEREIAQTHVDKLRIRPFLVEPELRTLSGGNQQKVALARWLTHLPRVLILSEPTRGMDVGAKEDVVKIVRDMQRAGVAIIVVSTEPETVLALAGRIIVMQKGHVTHEFANTSVSKDQLLAAA